MEKRGRDILLNNVANLSRRSLSPLDLLPHSDLREKCIDLVFNGIPENIDKNTASYFHDLRQHLVESRVDTARIVVFGGGSGLSNIIGGDSRVNRWIREPFCGLKEIFPLTHSVVCITDDGGSTGELIKDLPIIAIGDIRHVLLSSVQLQLLQNRYNLSFSDALKVVEGLAIIFNYRFRKNEITLENVKEIYSINNTLFPQELNKHLSTLIECLFSDERIVYTLNRPHCLGNLLLVAAVYTHIDSSIDNEKLQENGVLISNALFKGLSEFASIIGANEHSVLPCCTTPSQLRVSYSNGVEASGEHKSSVALRGFPVERVTVDFSNKPVIHKQVYENIESADIIILAPGSLYSSIIPIFQVPGIAEAVRSNKRAFKMLISNLWVQAGETDISISDPDRKFHVSDMLRAYERNIPGGTIDLFSDVLCLSLKDVPASILQNYALEGKIPIYLDKNIVRSQGFKPIECGIYSKAALAERGVIKHDPELLAQAIKTIYVSNELNESIEGPTEISQPSYSEAEKYKSKTRKTLYPSTKYRLIKQKIDSLPITIQSEPDGESKKYDVRGNILEVIWKHQDIPLSHLNHIKGVICVAKHNWRREQTWDKVYSFFDPEDGYIKIRSDQLFSLRSFETAFLIALGQSLLGNYAEEKRMENVDVNGLPVGKIYHLYIRDPEEMSCHFNVDELDEYLKFARMYPSSASRNHYTRLISGNEGFTPPGVLMGLTYAWYLDNRLASYIEYKMAIMKISKSDLIPEQLKMLARRNSLIHFFREVVFSP